MTYRGRYGFLWGVTAALVLVACGGGGGGGDNVGSGVSQGVFLDSAVEGVRYQTETRNGMTDALGTFSYIDGETVSFFIGSILLGSASGTSILTPIDLVPGADAPQHPTVTNIIRFLQTLDDDGIPTNGIRIIQPVFNALMDQDVDFAVSIEEFENDPAVQNLITAITGGILGAPRPLVPALVAQAHYAQTLAELAASGDLPRIEGTLSISGEPALGNSFTPDGPAFISIDTFFVSIQMNSLPQGDAVIGMGIGLFPDGSPTSISLVHESLSAATRFYILNCQEGADCSGLDADLDARQLQFQNLVMPPSGPGNAVTINGTLTY